MESNKAKTEDDLGTATAFSQAGQAPSDEELRLQALNHSKDKLLFIVGHDLRTSIGGVLTLSHMLEKRLEAGDLEEAKRLSGLIRRATLDADDLLKDLFAWARKSGHEQHFCLESIDIFELIKGEIGRLKNASQQKDLSIKIKADSTGMILADPNMLRSVFRNLLTNALKFSYPGGQITIRITRQAGLWEFQVCDNGIGMGDEIKDLLLKVDDRKQRPGTSGETGSGFGLLLCEDLIQRHGGHLSWESTPSKGSTFIFTIPELLG
jgi:signal transduction histidine kinase